MGSVSSLTSDQKVKIKEIIEAGEQILEEVDTLKEGLKDAVSNIGEELDIKPTLINKAIRLAYKNRSQNAIEDATQEMSDVEVILHAAGKI